MSSAPKFASFRPKPKAPEQPLPEEPRREEKDHRKRKASRETHRDERRSPPREERHRDESSRKPYFSDRRGDVDIVKYGTPNRYDIPSYRRTGYGNVLGLPDQKIDREYSTDKNIYMAPLVRQRQKRLLTDKHAARQSRRTLRLVKVAETHQTEATRDFIALSGTGKRKRDLGSDSEEDANAVPDVDYRGIDGKPDSDKLDDPDTYYESGTEATNTNSEVTQKNSRLIRETRDDPSNLQAWLDLIEHQEAMMKLDRAISELSVADRQNLADVRISTYEEALRKVGDADASRIELQAGLLREAQRHWNDEKASTRWQLVLKEHPHSVKLWFGYLDHAQSTFTRYKYEDCRAAFLQALEALHAAKSMDAAVTLQAQMHLFVRLTTMMQEAGYQELALAAWQAILEYNLMAPLSLTKDKMQHFEEFWESEAPRIGEADSKGWRHSSIEDAVPPTCSVILEIPGGPVSSVDDLRKRELEHMSKLRYPGRSTDEVGEDDPFHTIFFSDLKDIVANVPNAPAQMQFDAFLCFCGLPPLAGMPTMRPWWEDPCLQRCGSKMKCSIKQESETARFAEALSQYSRSPLPSFHMTSDLLVQQSFSLESSQLEPGFVRNILKLLATALPGDEAIGEYLLAFESAHFPSEVAKTAKRLLKVNPTSVRLYTMYALTENKLGNTAKASQVFAAALAIKSSPADRLQLLLSYVWRALHSGDKPEALNRLLLADTKSPSSITSSHSSLQTTLETALLASDLSSAVPCATLLALLSYLTSSHDASAALAVHANLTSWLISHRLHTSMHAETHAQSIAQFLARHISSTTIVRPDLMRSALSPYIALFPSNTLLLAIFAANEARFAIDDRVRGNVARVLDLSPTGSVNTWAFAIQHETLKGAVAGSTSHSIRALYHRATDVDAQGAHSPSLWKMWVRFEVVQLRSTHNIRVHKRPKRDGKKSKWEIRVEEQENRVRETFYEGLKRVPWCKDFIMLAFTDAREIFSNEELARLYSVMAEKEHRLYIELEEPT
jgi:tetratricopeptide (TPR) repeat protein